MLDLQCLLLGYLGIQYVFHDEAIMVASQRRAPWFVEGDTALGGV